LRQRRVHFSRTLAPKGGIEEFTPTTEAGNLPCKTIASSNSYRIQRLVLFRLLNALLRLLVANFI